MSFAALQDIRVLDLTSVVVGPACTARLAQYGATVIKVESPEGDLMRGLGGLSPTGQHSGAYLHMNRSKQNICCDLKSPAGKAVVDKLVARSDVVVANMRPRALASLGLDAATIRAKYPGVIYCLITGYGTDGPYAGHPAYDSVVQAVSGITGLTLARDGTPAYVPMLICDHVAGEISAGAIMAALVRKERSGEGCTIEIPMFETMASFVLQEHLAQQSFDPPMGPAGDQRLLSPYNKPVKTADGWISFTINTDKQVAALLKATGRESLIRDERFSTVAQRAKNVKEWFEIRGADLVNKTTAEWLEIFALADIAAKPCHTLESLPKDPHLTAVGLLQRERHPVEGDTFALRPSIQFDGAPSGLGSFAQPRGWDTCVVLEALGYSQSEIQKMLTENSVFSGRIAEPL